MEEFKRICRSASAGFEEKNDALVEVVPLGPGSGVQVEIKSSVQLQYGDAIRQVVLDTIKEEGYTDLAIKVFDKGAWDYALRARVITALTKGAAECD